MHPDQTTAGTAPEVSPAKVGLNRGLWWLVGGVIIPAALVIAGLGFAVSYHSVQTLAATKEWHFGNFSYLVPIIMDAGIVVLLALDVVLTYLRMPFPLLRQGAWVLTLATIAANASSAWPHPVPVLVHGLAPGLFILVVEASRHAIERLANIKAGKHMEGVRAIRWLLSPVPTFRLWRRMKLWEITSYDVIVDMEQNRLVYRQILRNEYGRSWRRKAPVEALLPLKLASLGRPLPELIAPQTALIARHTRPAAPVEEPVSLPAAESDVPQLPAAAPVETAEFKVESAPVDIPFYEPPFEMPAGGDVPLARPVQQQPLPEFDQPRYYPGQPAASTVPAPASADWNQQQPAEYPEYPEYADPAELGDDQAVALATAPSFPGQRPESFEESYQQPSDDQLDEFEQEYTEETPPAKLSCRQAVEQIYPTLTEDQLQLNTSELARELAPKLGYEFQSVRRYLTEIRKTQP